MNPLTTICLQDHLALAQPECSDIKELVPNKLIIDQSYESHVNEKSLSERSVESSIQFHFLNEELIVEKFYIEKLSDKEVCIKEIDDIEHYDEKKVQITKCVVFPFVLNGVKHYKIDARNPVLDKDCLVSLSCAEEVNVDLCYRAQVKKRLSELFTKGFKSVCKTVSSFENEEDVIRGICHHFVNYLAFGMDKQISQNFSEWYEKLPFVSIHIFDKKKIRWGDIVQFLSGDSVIHSMFYIGDGRYISKHGPLDIYFQSLPAAQATYPCDTVWIVRLAAEYYSKNIPFKESY